jgi:hypothetical protein
METEISVAQRGFVYGAGWSSRSTLTSSSSWRKMRARSPGVTVCRAGANSSRGSDRNRRRSGCIDAGQSKGIECPSTNCGSLDTRGGGSSSSGGFDGRINVLGLQMDEM